MTTEEPAALLAKLITEAPQIAPSIARFNETKSYGKVTDEALNTQAFTRWELQARSLIAQLAARGQPIFGELHSEYEKLKAKAATFHSRSILVHMVMELLMTARELVTTSEAPTRLPPADLDPWPVIRGLALELSSYEVPKAIDRTGLTVDWSLTDKQDFSDKTRKAIYRPRIDAAYAELPAEGKLRVAYVLAKELAARGLEAQLGELLRVVGWSIDQGTLAPVGSPVRELFFPQMAQHDAYVEIRALLQRAGQSITIVDPYMDQSTLTLLATAVKPQMQIRLLTTKLPADFALEAKAWCAQNRDVNIQVRTTKEFHDRFVVVDDVSCWHIGASLKDAGAKAFMLSQIEDAENRRALFSHIESSWNAATSLPGL